MSLAITPAARPTVTIYNSATRALTTPELLEMILFHLPIRSLIRAQRVSFEWHNNISASKTLRARIGFLSPSPLSATLSSGESITTFNPKMISTPSKAAMNVAIKLARKMISSSDLPFGIPFSHTELLGRPEGPWMDKMISQPRSQKITVTTLWTSDIKFSKGDSSAPKFCTLGPCQAMRKPLAGESLTWGDVRRDLEAEVEFIKKQNSALSRTRGRAVHWRVTKVAWLRFDGAVLDTDETVLRENCGLLA